jgi:hypothetical protein
MANSSVRYKGNLSTNVPNTIAGVFSPSIWADCPVQRLRDAEVSGSLVEMRGFEEYPLAGTLTTQIGFSKFKVFATSAGTIAPVTTFSTTKPVGNVLAFTFDTDADDSASLAQAYPSFRMSGLTSNSGKLWFEAEVGVNVITTNGTAMFCGLAETDLWTLATGVPFNAGDPITNSAAAIGFRHTEDGLGTIDTVYSDRATSFTNIGDDEGTIAAATLIKWGMVYDPKKTTDCVTFYQNGIPLATKLSAAALVALTNLDAGVLGFLFAACADTVDTGIAYLSQFRVAQLSSTP